jgi:type IV pilus assembly protein PilO
MKRPPIDFANINWNLNAAWSWPAPIRVVVIIFSTFLLAVVFFNYDTQNELNELQRLKQNEKQLKTVFEIKQKQTGNLLDQQVQFNVIESQWLEMAVKMPENESASILLHTISQMGIHYNLEFKSLQLLPKVTPKLFEELPVQMEVIGKYNDLYAFMRELEKLATLVTLHDLTISSQDNLQTNKLNNRLLMTLLIKAYRESPSENTKKNVAQ